jgi:DNA-binding transcriptional LysR family regulator
LDILQLEHFLAVIDERNFTRAAERVFRTQPALSQSIKKLEEKLGTALFAREANDVSLTEAGKVLAEYARKILKLRDEATRSIAQIKSVERGFLSIAAHESAALYLLPDRLLQFAQLFPEVKLGIYRARLDEIPGRVLDREVHIGFVKDKPAFQKLESIEVHVDRMVLVASPEHELAGKDEVSIQDLNGTPLVVHHLCSSTEEVVLRLFQQNGTRCNVVAELWSFENIKEFVGKNIGLAIVPRITVLEELRCRKLVEIPLPALNIRRSTMMIFRRDYISEAASCLIDIMLNRDTRSSCKAASAEGLRQTMRRRVVAV